MTAQHLHFDGETVRLRTGNDPAVKRLVGHRRYMIAADLGSAKDPTGITITQDEQLPVLSDIGWVMGPRNRTLVFAERLREHRYTEIAEYLRALMTKDALRGRCRLAIDASGVGRGCSDFLHEANIPHTAVQMVAGTSMRRAGRFFNVSKQLLMSELAVALEIGALRIAGDLPAKQDLLVELESFQTKQSASGVQILDAGGGDHHADLAVSLAIGWFATEHASGFTGEGQLIGWI